MIGMINSVKTVDVKSPPIMTHAMLTLVSAPSVIDKAVGSIPTIIVMVVMKIGFKRTFPASMTASIADMPRSIRVSV